MAVMLLRYAEIESITHGYKHLPVQQISTNCGGKFVNICYTVPACNLSVACAGGVVTVLRALRVCNTSSSMGTRDAPTAHSRRKDNTMKETTKMSRAVGQLEKMYNTLNMDKFAGELPTPIITVQSKPGTWGHCTIGKVWKRKDGETYEMNIAAEVMDREIEEIIDTLLHEMVHLYCRENGIQEVSRGGKYHNKKFKALAEEKGLVCVQAGQYGWNTQGIGNDSLIEYALEKGWSELKISRGTWQQIRIPTT